MVDLRVFENFLNERECRRWIHKAPKFVGSYDFTDRTIDITNFRIVGRVKKFLQKNCKCKLTCHQAQIQLWPIDSKSNLHIHTEDHREMTDYNSLIYLNDNFVGGEFLLENLHIRPKSGMLTFFNGSKLHHGVNKVQNNHRYTLIFWWKNTIFCNNDISCS